MATFAVLRIGKKSVRIAPIAAALSGTLFAGASEWTSLGPEGPLAAYGTAWTAA
jgi:hypothetical protein